MVEAAHARQISVLRWRLPGNLAAAGLAGATVAGTAAAQGAYFPTSWGWTAVLLAWAAAVALLFRRRIRLSWGELTFVALLGLLAGWIVLSAVWSESAPGSVAEFERDLIYPLGALVILLVARRRGVERVLGGLLGGIGLICLYSLATRLFPNRFGFFDSTDPVARYRLAEPIGYWNALSVYAAMGAFVAFGFAVRSRRYAARSLSAALLCVLLPTVVLTFGRGVWIAVLVALAAAVGIDPRRLQLVTGALVVLPAPLLAVWVALHERGLTHSGSSLSQATHAGHRLAVAIAILAPLTALASAVLLFAEGRVRIGRRPRLAYAGALLAICAVVLVAVFARYGSPAEIAKRGYAGFKSTSAGVSDGNYGGRLFNFTGNGRFQLWQSAWRDYQRHQSLGSGAGTFEEYWYTNRSIPSIVRDAHGLYIEKLAELGPVGLALLAGALGVPLAAAWKARRHRLVPPVAGAYVVYLVAAAADWDWELPAVTLTAIFLGATLVMLAWRGERTRPLTRRVRIGIAAVLAPVAAFALIALVGNIVLSRSHAALQHGNAAKAAADARSAADLAPWSAEPWVALATAQLVQGKLPAARRSYRRALEKDPRDWALWWRFGIVSTGRQRCAALRRARELNPLERQIVVGPGCG